MAVSVTHPLCPLLPTVALVLCSCKQDTGPLDRVGLECTVSAFAFHWKGDCESWRAWLITARQTSEYGSKRFNFLIHPTRNLFKPAAAFPHAHFHSFLSDHCCYSLSLSFSFSFLGFHNYQGRRGIESCCFWGDFSRVNGSCRSQLSSSLRSVELLFRAYRYDEENSHFPNKYLCERGAALCNCERGRKSKKIHLVEGSVFCVRLIFCFPYYQQTTPRGRSGSKHFWNGSVSGSLIL